MIPTLGDFVCVFWHMWPWRGLWIKTIGAQSGEILIICRACGRKWTL